MTKNQPPVAILASDHLLWIVPAMLCQLEKYWRPLPSRVILAGFTPPAFVLPEWVEWCSIGEFSQYPAQKWSNGLIDFLRMHPELETFALLLEDYLIARPVDTEATALLYQYAKDHPDILRVDLSSDRLGSSQGKREVGYLGRLDLFEVPPPAEYHVSTQPALWNRARLLEVLRPNESAWNFEIMGTNRANISGMRVIGTRQVPIRHRIAVLKGRLDMETPWQVPPTALTAEDIQDLRNRGLIPG